MSTEIPNFEGPAFGWILQQEPKFRAKLAQAAYFEGTRQYIPLRTFGEAQNLIIRREDLSPAQIALGGLGIQAGMDILSLAMGSPKKWDLEVAENIKSTMLLRLEEAAQNLTDGKFMTQPFMTNQFIKHLPPEAVLDQSGSLDHIHTGLAVVLYAGAETLQERM